MRVFLDLVSLKSRCTAVMQYSAIKCWTTIRWVAPFCPHAYSISSSHVTFRRVCKYDCTYVRHARIRPTTRAACCQAKRTLLSLLIALCLYMWAGQTFTHTRTHTRTHAHACYTRTCVHACMHACVCTFNWCITWIAAYNLVSWWCNTIVSLRQTYGQVENILMLVDLHAQSIYCCGYVDVLIIQWANKGIFISYYSWNTDCMHQFWHVNKFMGV